MMGGCGNIPEGGSSRVRSIQAGVHPRLLEIVRSHLAAPWRQPLHEPSVAAFGKLAGLVDPEDDGGLVLDSGCGTGTSTRSLACLHEGAVVIGIDKSRKRLSKQGCADGPRREERVILVRADLPSFWRLAAAARWRIRRHYLLYPNPWPKPAQLRRRWHAHPVFPVLLGLGGVIELRCNWRVYAEEFALAASVLSGAKVPVTAFRPGEPLSPHEYKYVASGHELYRVVVPDGAARQRD
jgi:tRNA (guanine-N7-)-methyltransferase